jgi:TRAP-type mannitol/chloroaromatic compound transport system substrate-binding protein
LASRTSRSISAELKAILRNAAHAATADQLYTAYDRYTKDLEAIKKRGVSVIHTNEKVLNAQLQSWTKVIAAQEKDPKTGAFFKKVADSQRDWVKRTQVYLNTNNLSTAELAVAYKHFFG